MRPAEAGAGRAPAAEPGAASLSVVVPCFNAAGTLDRLIERVLGAVAGLADDWELILVNDGSADRSWERIVEWAGRDERVRGIDLTRNFGQHNALLAGIAAARMEVIVTLDDDLQSPPEEIPKLLSGLERGADVVYGAPIERNQPFHRRLASIGIRATLLALTRSGAKARVSGFRALRARVGHSIQMPRGRRVSVDALLRGATGRFAVVEVRHESRRAGRSGYTLPVLVRHAAAEITGSLPLGPIRGRNQAYAIRAVTGEARSGSARFDGAS